MLCACGCGRQGHDWHHALIHRMKWYPCLNDPHNLVFMNHWEHVNRKFDCLMWRKFFYRLNCQKFPDMQEWLDGLPAKLNSRKDFI
jgi:hypothetical protein